MAGYSYSPTRTKETIHMPVGSGGQRQSFKPRNLPVFEPDGSSRDSFVKEEVVVEEETTEEESSEKSDQEDDKQRRKRLFFIVGCVLIFILVIVILAVLLSLLGTGDGSSNIDIGGEIDCGPITNQTKPATKDEYMCDLLTTLKTDQYTWLRTFGSSTAYGKAVLWMTNSDEVIDSTPAENLLERFIMVLFYFSTGGKDSWYNRFKFLAGDKHLCSWSGDSSRVILCAFADRKVTDLGIPENGMIGKLPTELGYLTGLTRIYFFNNLLTGTIPSELGRLTKLTGLHLNLNKLKGKIPTELDQMTQLTTLRLENNNLNGNLTELCSAVSAVSTPRFRADCDTGRVLCDCCNTCKRR